MIIKEIIRSNIDRMLNWRLLGFFAVYGLFSFLFKISALQIGLNFFEYVSELFCNQHTIVYFLIPVYFLIVFNLLAETSNFVITRVGKFKNYFMSKCFSYLVISSIIVIGMLSILFIMGLGLPFINKYVLTLEYASNFIGPSFIHMFATPLSLILAQSVHMILGLTFLSIVLESIYIIFNNKNISLIVLGISYIFTIFSASGKLSTGLSPFLINTYTTLSNDQSFLIKTILIEILFFILLFFAISKYWYIKIAPFRYLAEHSIHNWSIKRLLHKKFIYTSSILLILVNISLYLTLDTTCFSDYIYVQFLGYGTGYFNVLFFSIFLIVMCTPLFFQSYFLQEELQNNCCFVKIRYNSKLAYLKQMLLTFFIFTTFYIILFSLVTFLVGLIIALKSGTLLSSGNYNFAGFDLLIIIGKAFLLKGLEIYMILLLSLTISIYTKKIGLAFFIPFIGYTINIFEFGFNKFNPFGISSIARWGITTDYNISFSHALLILCMANTILLIFLIFKGQKNII